MCGRECVWACVHVWQCEGMSECYNKFCEGSKYILRFHHYCIYMGHIFARQLGKQVEGSFVIKSVSCKLRSAWFKPTWF